jgi:K+-sensing histidine kinase KdpD
MVVILAADYFAGPYIQFPVTYIIPVALVSWHNGKFWGYSFAVTMSVMRVMYSVFIWKMPWSASDTIINLTVSFSVFALLVTLFDKVAAQNRELSKKVDVLTGLLPICSNCKKIKNDTDNWEQVESYISKKSSASFTHSLCPECRKKLYGAEIEKLKAQNK